MGVPPGELGPLGESKSNCWSLHHVYRLEGSKSFESSKTIVLIWNIQSPHEANLYRLMEATKSEHRKLWAQCKLSTSLSQGRLGTIDPSGNFVRVVDELRKCPHLSDTFVYRSAHSNSFLTLRVIHEFKIGRIRVDGAWMVVNLVSKGF